MALFMVIGLISLSFTGFRQDQGQAEEHILGGPEVPPRGEDLGAPTPGDSLGAAFIGQDVDNYGISIYSVATQSENAFNVAALQDSRGIAGGALEARKAVFTYEAQEGDTLSGIGANFGVSLETLIQANPALRNASLKPGQKLTILPVSGILYTVVAKDTLSSIAASYRVETDKIKEYNPEIKENLVKVGMKLVVPGAKEKEPVVAAKAAAKVTLAGASTKSSYFIQPASGFNWGVLHGHNGVDIANTKGTAVVAAADGVVVPDAVCQMDDGWNGGYGRCVMIEHPNGLTTLYAHLSTVGVELGDYVKQGQFIGAMGSTGKSTGSHLHFEVRGASNPFAGR